MSALLLVIVGLGAPGFLPALAVAGRAPVLVFLAPLIGAGMAAVAAELELGVGGSLPTCYAVVAVAANVAVIAWWLAAGRFRLRAGPPWGWSIVTVVAVLGALIIPLSALRAPIIGWDANSIWLTHALMVSGGHHELLAGLQNAVYRFSNPDYPPLVPAAGALAFALFGRGDLHVAIDVTVLLNACALGIVGTGVAAVGSRRRQVTRLVAIAAAGAICLVGFAVSGGYGVDGYADLLWAAAAVGAIIWGLVLPRSTQTLVVASICAAVASLTKNEGLTTALIVLILIALRYRPLTLPGLRRLRAHPENRGLPDAAASQMARKWTERAAFVVVPALPGLAWAVMARLIGLQNAFFVSSSTESLLSRADATIAGMAAHLAVAPVAVAVLVAGCCFLRRDRERARLGNPAWLWTACLVSLAIIFATYLFGAFEIHGWLANSVNRTTIFAQVLLYADLAIWLVLAFDGVSAHEGSEQREASPAAVSAAGDAGHDREAGSLALAEGPGRLTGLAGAGRSRPAGPGTPQAESKY